MSAAQARVFVALGSNLNSPERQVRRGVQALDEVPHSQVVRASSLYCSAPVGLAGEHPDFVNAVCEMHSTLTPHELLAELHALERRLGRMRGGVVGSRIIDLDLLLYDDVVIADERLTLPHPRMHVRAFVLRPLHEIAPDTVIPRHGAVATLLPQVAEQKISLC